MCKEAITVSSKECATGVDAPGNTSLPFRMALDTPVEGECLLQDAPLVGLGWVLAGSQVEEVAIFIGGVLLCRAAIGIRRPDVGLCHPQYPNRDQCGFSFTAVLTQIPPGNRGLTVRVQTADGLAREHVVRIQIKPPQPKLPTTISSGRPVAWEAQKGDADAPAGEKEEYLKLVIDNPRLVGGSAADPVNGSLTIQGWALSRVPVEAVRIAIDELELGEAHYGIRRDDVVAAFPDWNATAACGFGASVPPKVLTRGKHSIRVEVSDQKGRKQQTTFGIEVLHEAQETGPGVPRTWMSAAESALSRQVLAGLQWYPRFEILLVIESTDVAQLELTRLTLASLVAQEHENWHVTVILPRGSALDEAAPRLLAGLDDAVARIAVIASDPGLPLGAEGTFVTVLRSGDRLGCDALLEVAIATGLDRSAEFIYSDERRTDPVSGEVTAFFKPGWSPDLLLSTNYIGRLWFACMPLLSRLEMTLPRLIGGSEYGLILTLTRHTHGVKHIPSVLCDRGPYATEDVMFETAALQDAIRASGVEGEILPGCTRGTYRLRRTVPLGKRVAIIISTCGARGLVKTCITSLRQHTRYREFEIICIENLPESAAETREWLRENTDRLITCDASFNWSKFNNLAAAAASTGSEYLLFLNDDVEIIEPDWLEAMLEHAQRDEVGVVGPLLLYPNRRIQHASMFMPQLGKARHAFRFAREDEPGPFGLALTQRNALAVTGACLLVRRATYESLGGFDEAHTIINNDLDFCLRCLDKGLRVMFTPYAKLVHHEMASRARIEERYDAAAFESRWKHRFTAGDPYYSPRLIRNGDNFGPDPEPLQIISGGHPLLRAQQIHSILAVKLDHIGDFITSLAALRRLRACFPTARLCLLASSATAKLAYLEPVIDEVIEFNFFNARSSLGQLPILDADLLALQRRLAPYRFDVAIDLRKHTDTRHILQHTGAKLTAGYDFGGRFPWLNVAIEWDGDRSLVAKRQHIADDLLRLVDAVATSCEQDRRTISASVRADLIREPLPGLPWNLLLRRPLVCVHPLSGNSMRQWPLAHFVELIDLLVAEFALGVCLIGTDEEKPTIEQIAWQVQRPGAVFCLAGTLPLPLLPQLLSRCALFVGNNSGPKHIAAGLGIPTVGVHSGIVDAVEWAPMGPAALAVRRNMSCSPCYLADPGRCHRNLACLTELKPHDVLPVCRQLLAISGIVGKPTGSSRTPERHNTLLTEIVTCAPDA